MEITEQKEEKGNQQEQQESQSQSSDSLSQQDQIQLEKESSSSDKEDQDQPKKQKLTKKEKKDLKYQRFQEEKKLFRKEKKIKKKLEKQQKKEIEKQILSEQQIQKQENANQQPSQNQQDQLQHQEEVKGENGTKDQDKQQNDQSNNQEQKQIYVKKSDYKRQQLQSLMENAPKVIIDLQFMDLLQEKEWASLLKQLSQCHFSNRNAKLPVNLCFTSWNKDSRFAKRLVNEFSALNWGYNVYSENLLVQFQNQKEKIIYLTGDAKEDMDKMEDDKIYIIGGLVDHNRLKNTTYDWAVQNGIKTQRFPIKKYIDLKSSPILIVNHDIIIDVHNGKSWKETFEKNIPGRKQK